MFSLDFLNVFFALPESYSATISMAVFGLLIGSFLNVVIYRIPKMMEIEFAQYIAEQNGTVSEKIEPFNLSVPRSACPKCNHKISAIENIPVLSYLFLRGRCKGCASSISVRYPLFEIATGILFALMTWKFGTGLAGLSACIFTSFLVALIGIDIDTKLLPDDLTYPLIWIGLLVNCFGTFVGIRESVFGAALGYCSLWSIYWLFKILTGKEGMGYGDFKLLAALGAWFGWKSIPMIMVVSAGVGVLFGAAMILSLKIKRDEYFAFGPYLAAAGILTMYFGSSLMPEILRLT